MFGMLLYCIRASSCVMRSGLDCIPLGLLVVVRRSTSFEFLRCISNTPGSIGPNTSCGAGIAIFVRRGCGGVIDPRSAQLVAVPVLEAPSSPLTGPFSSPSSSTRSRFRDTEVGRAAPTSSSCSYSPVGRRRIALVGCGVAVWGPFLIYRTAGELAIVGLVGLGGRWVRRRRGLALGPHGVVGVRRSMVELVREMGRSSPLWGCQLSFGGKGGGSISGILVATKHSPQQEENGCSFT